MDHVADQFRVAMRRMASTVSIVTTTADGRAHGMVATSLSSLSFEPASLLVCINRSTYMHGAICNGSRFCVNILHQDQAKLACLFSDVSKRDLRFTSGGWKMTDDSLPYLPDAQASLVCDRAQLVSFGTHTICIGTIQSVHVREDIAPLVYLNRNYCALPSCRAA